MKIEVVSTMLPQVNGYNTFSHIINASVLWSRTIILSHKANGSTQRVVNTISIPTGWEGGGRAGSHEVIGKSYVFTKNSQMASTGVTSTSTYHTK